MKVGCLILAAGQGRRMGQPKQAILLEGRPMLRRVVDQVLLSGLPLCVVTGAHAELADSLIPDVQRIYASRHALGLAESLKAGLLAAPEDWDAALILLGDMPFVQPQTLQKLAEALREHAQVVVPVYEGKWGNPAGFSRSSWPQLMQLQGDQGARAIMRSMEVLEIAVDDPFIHRDFDTIADLQAISGGLQAPPSVQ